MQSTRGASSSFGHRKRLFRPVKVSQSQSQSADFSPHPAQTYKVNGRIRFSPFFSKKHVELALHGHDCDIRTCDYSRELKLNAVLLESLNRLLLRDEARDLDLTTVSDSMSCITS
jgi:hypothetical protein